MGEASESTLERYGIAVVYGMLGAIAFGVVLLILFRVPSGRPVTAARFVVYVLTAAGIGLAFGLAGLSREPLGFPESALVASITLLLPSLAALLLANTTVILWTILAFSLITLGSYAIPRVHQRIAAKRGQLFTKELRTVLVPAVAVGLILAVVTAGSLVVDTQISRESECGGKNLAQVIPLPPLGDGPPDSAVRVGWEFEQANDSVVVMHAGGEEISSDRLFVAVGQSSVAWARLTSNPNGTVQAGDTARLTYVEPGDTVRIRWSPEDADCERTLGEHEL